MSTWRLLSNDGSGYRWEAAGNEATAAQVPWNDSVSRLPSMSDLLLQGCPKLLEENGGPSFGSSPMFSTCSGKPSFGSSPMFSTGSGKPSFGSTPMFSTGSGKSVALKQSSIAKALAVLGDDDCVGTGCPKLHEENGRQSFGRSPMFSSGSGKPSFGSSAMFSTGSVKPSSGSMPMFSTGSGKSMALKQSSMAKALAVLGDDDFPDTGQVHLNHYGPRTNSLFQTASGKTVHISSAGLVKGKTLLRLEEESDHCTFEAPKFTGKLASDGEIFRTQNSTILKRESAEVADVLDKPSVSSDSLTCKALVGSSVKGLGDGNVMEQKVHDIHKKPAPIKFQTAGGKSISISTDALKRARSLLGDPEIGNFLGEGDPNGKHFPFVNGKRSSSNSSRKENEPPNLILSEGTPHKKDMALSFVSPLKASSSNRVHSLNMSNKIAVGSNLISEFDAAARENDCRSNSDLAYVQNPLTDRPCVPGDRSFIHDNSSLSNFPTQPSRGPLVDISNRMDRSYSNSEKSIREKRTIGRTCSVSPFKRPRSSKFSTPFKRNSSLLHSGLSTMSVHSSKGRVSTRYPFLVRRASMKEYFGGPPEDHDMGFPRAGKITSGNAEKFVFSDEAGSYCVGAEDFFHMLVQSGASAQYISQGWVTNHYRWIVWKLAHYERCYPAKCARFFLTVSNVLEELKYRYEREVNHGHRSAIKRILEGDSLPSSMIVLRVSAIHIDHEPKIESSSVSLEGIQKNNMAKVELTDGWYSVGAIFDTLLSKHCDSGKVSVGQKLRIWGARLNGWAGPTSPLEVTDTVNLLVHVNGTYRAHWADRLGFCKGPGAPLAFRCIKSHGGPVPRTFVGVTRIYPILYKERLSGRDSIVRSEKMEMKIRQIYSQRRTAIIEGVMSQFRRGSKDFLHLYNDSDSEEGAKISKVLETAAEPEVIMAEMSPDQLNAFATYRSKMEANRQSDTEKLIEKALQDAGLREREVTPFMRLRVVGLQSKALTVKDGPEGLITIWNPTEMQQHDLVEGSAYAISGLLPTGSSSDTIYLQARGSTTKWKPLTPREIETFRPFFTPRKAISLSKLGEVPLSSEFDIAGFVLYVGEASAVDRQRRQWVFVTDGSSTAEPYPPELSNSLLAISFCVADVNDISSIPFNPNLVGSTVGFCNLIKKAKDQTNHLWVADTTKNSIYSLKFDPTSCSHLKDAAASTRQWAHVSGSIIDELKQRISFITGDCGH